LYNVFIKPIIFELKPSYSLAVNFMLIGLIPTLSCLILFQRWPLLVIGITIFLLTSCLHLIVKYAIRYSDNSVKLLRLHKNTALITYRNLDTKSAVISKISVASDWVILQVGDESEKIILDENSVDGQSYSNLRRQIIAFKTD